MDDIIMGIKLVLVAAIMVGILLTMWVTVFDFVQWSDVPLAFVTGFLGTICFAAACAAVWIMFLGLVVALT